MMQQLGNTVPAILDLRILTELSRLEGVLSTSENVAFTEICSRRNTGKKGWYLSLTINRERLKVDYDEIVFEIICTISTNQLSFDGDFSFASGQVFKKLPQIIIPLNEKWENGTKEEGNKLCEIYFDNAEDNLKNMVKGMV